MKLLQLICLVGMLFFTGCRGCNDQADKMQVNDSVTINQDNVKPDTSTAVQQTDTLTKNPETTGSINPPDEKTPARPGPDNNNNTSSRKTDPGVLARIDNYLVSTPKFTPGPNGGISQASITVKNTMSGTSFQRVMLEVTQLAANGSVIDIAYHSLVNLEPGDSKQVTLPDNPKVTRIIAHVVKVTSKELTNGESVATGAGYKG